jgi:hypothetical protein
VGSSPTRTRPWVVVVLVALLAIGSMYAYYVVTFDVTERMCTIAGWGGAPVADSPEAAFDAWFATWQGEWAGSDSSAHAGASPDRSDFDRVGDEAWEWEYTDGQVVRVDVVEGNERREFGAGEWAVDGVTQCTTPDQHP